MAENDSVTGLAITIPEEVFTDLDKLEGKIKSLETVTNSASKNIVASFLRMANGVDPFIKKVQLAGKTLGNMFPAGDDQMNKLLSSIVDVANALNKLNTGRQPVTGALGDPNEVARLSSELKKQQKEIERLNKSIERLIKGRKTSSVEEKAATIAETTFRRAMFATEATLNQRINKIAKLREAERQLTAAGKGSSEQIRIIRAEMERLNRVNEQAAVTTDNVRRSQHHLLDISGQLMRSLALVFSVSQVTQYVQKLAQVRGEFELQNAALAAILQNKDEADQLFGRITELAVQSPFNLKELVTYTKELAAYRVESEKLYDTTKMLADVSAGLGVDMSRLILAYGQVKAANYLRGTELRQFSEAGINILGELATYFSEIEQRAVSVGEVFDMVSRRMVSFQDVEKIFQRITSEGGIFANMQEVQSRTLAGMVSNLQDAVDIMLNDIGKETEGTLKGAVNLMRQLVENWRTVAAIGKGLLIPLAGYNAILFTLQRRLGAVALIQKGINALQITFTTLIKGSTAAQALFNTTTAANPYLLAASIIIGVLTAVVSLIRNATEEQRRMNQTISEGAQRASELSANFERLANIAVSDSSSTEEQTAAIEEMNRKYGDLIPSHYRNIKALKEMEGDYQLVTNAIYAKIDAQTREKLTQDEINNSGEKINNRLERIRKELERTGISTESAMAITREFQERLNNGEYAKSEEAVQGLMRIIEDFTGEADKAVDVIGRVWTKVTKIFNLVKDMKEELDDIANMEFKPFRKGGDTKIYRQLKEGLDNIISTTDDYRKRLQESGFTFTYSIELDEAAKDLQISKIQTFINQLQQQIDSGIIDEKDVASVQNIIEDAQKAIENIRVSDTTEQINDLRVSFSKLSDIDFGTVLNVTEMRQGEGRGEYLERLKKQIDEMSKTVDEFYETVDGEKVRRDVPLFQAEYLLGNKSLEQYEKELNTLIAFYKQLANLDEEITKKGSAGNSEEERIKKIIAMLKEMREQYKKLREEYSEKEATAMVQTSYAQTAKDLELPDDFLTTMTFDVSGIIDGAKKVFKTTSDEGKKLINQFTDGLETEIDLEIRVKNREKIKNELDSLFSDYEMTLEIQKLGGDISWADLFGIDWTTTGDIQRQAEETISKLTAIGGEKAQEDIKKIQERVHTAIENEQKQWIQKFADILSKSVDEIQSVQQKGLKGISVAKQFFDEEKLSAEQYAAVIKYIVKSVNEETSRITLDKFKQSSDYIQAMGDLSAYSTTELQRLLNRLKEVVAASAGNMDAENLRTYMDAIQNVQDAINQRKTPFQKNEIAQLQELNRLEDEFSQEQERQLRLQQERLMWQMRVNEAQERLNVLKKQQEAGDTSTETAFAISMANADLIDATENLQNADNEITTSQANLSTISGKIGNIIGDVSAAMFKIEAVFNQVINGINGAIGLFENISELADSFGIDTEEGGWSDAKIFFDSLGEISQDATQAFQSFSSGDIIGGITSSLSMLMDAVKFFNNLHDNQREKIIVAETGKVERLAEAYEEIEKTIDKAQDASDFQRFDQQLTQNYKKQMASYDRMIAAEKDKKNPDEDTIKEWEDAQKSLAESYAENIEGALVEAGGIARDEYLSQTRDFVDAWMEAFRETGNGLSGLEDNFEEFFMNVLKQQAEMAISKKFIQPIIDDLNAALGDYELDDKEAQDLYDNAMATMPELSKFLEEWFKPFLGMIGDTEEGSLSGLQKGIQGVTEETAQIIEALLNSMRYYVADTNAKLNSIYLMLSGTEGVPNPMLVELRAQTEQLRAINRLIRNVTASGHPNGGDGIKIFMN